MRAAPLPFIERALQRRRRDLAGLACEADELEPPPKNSGAPHSSVAMCASSWHSTAPHGGVRCASASAFAAVPVGTRNTATSR